MDAAPMSAFPPPDDTGSQLVSPSSPITTVDVELVVTHTCLLSRTVLHAGSTIAFRSGSPPGSGTVSFVQSGYAERSIHSSAGWMTISVEEFVKWNEVSGSFVIS